MFVSTKISIEHSDSGYIIRRGVIILLTIISSEFIASSTNLPRVENLNVPVKINRSS